MFVPAGGIMKVIGYQFAAPTKPEIGKESIAYTTVIYTYNAPEKTKESMKIGNDTYYKFNQIFFISSISVNVIKKAGNNDTNDAIAKTIDFASNFVPGKVIMQTGGWAISVALQKQLQQNEADLKVEIKTLSSIARIGYITSYWGKDGRPVSLFPDVKLPVRCSTRRDNYSRPSLRISLSTRLKKQPSTWPTTRIRLPRIPFQHYS